MGTRLNEGNDQPRLTARASPRAPYTLSTPTRGPLGTRLNDSNDPSRITAWASPRDPYTLSTPTRGPMGTRLNEGNDPTRLTARASPRDPYTIHLNARPDGHAVKRRQRSNSFNRVGIAPRSISLST
ncbi:hypothetical protein CA51_42280 [Rosistilla oblonga]|nr:hypothetical protein CA51_42280 [Rosistilla oblonga]